MSDSGHTIGESNPYHPNFVPPTSHDIFVRIAALERKVAILSNGGCTCQSPMWYYANMIGFYCCLHCLAKVAPAMASEEIVAIAQRRHGQ